MHAVPAAYTTGVFMSYSMTYSSLLVDVRRYLERGFTLESDPIVYEQLPRLVTLGERRIARELKIQGFIRAIETPLTPGVAVYMKPDRWRDTVSMTIDNVPPVRPRNHLVIRIIQVTFETASCNSSVHL